MDQKLKNVTSTIPALANYCSNNLSRTDNYETFLFFRTSITIVFLFNKVDKLSKSTFPRIYVLPSFHVETQSTVLLLNQFNYVLFVTGLQRKLTYTYTRVKRHNFLWNKNVRKFRQSPKIHIPTVCPEIKSISSTEKLI